MPTPDEELQAAADRGDLAKHANERMRKIVDYNERRWTVSMVKDMAVAHQLSLEEFKELCKWIRDFISSPEPSG